jgi:hypothetical protein
MAGQPGSSVGSGGFGQAFIVEQAYAMWCLGGDDCPERRYQAISHVRS